MSFGPIRRHIFGMIKSSFCIGPLSASVALICLLAFGLQAQTPEWIWYPNHGQTSTNSETRYFRKTFPISGKVKTAILSVAADDSAEVFCNDKRELKANGWAGATCADVTAQLKSGNNLIAIRGKNDTAVACVIARLEITLADGRKQTLVTDQTWQASAVEEPGWQSPQFKPSGSWVAAVSLGRLGMEPWGDALKIPRATSAENLTVLAGFKVQLLHSALVNEGSWICMTVDPKGRLIISPQKDDQPLLRVALDRAGEVVNIETIPAPVHQAMGLCGAHDSLYVNGHGPNGTGLYRLIDANLNDRFDTNEVHFLKKFAGEGEHGYHAVVEGPDGMIYVMNGNHTKVPEGISPDSPHQHYEEDLLLPRLWDATGHAVGVLAPGGQILRTDPAGKHWELLLAGFRNSYDFDFSPDGEIFTFDSDMEWDWGLPWYRPIRIIHCVSGGEYGWRSGSAKRPIYYADTLPPTVNIGIGSPTGVKFGTKSDFPEKYKSALFAMDWSYGRILAVHMLPRGASFIANFETFVQGKPLNVTDLEFGLDGAMYFITGGRGTQSGLYRVSYVGAEEPAKETDEVLSIRASLAAAGERERKLRHQLEAYHGRKNPVAIGVAWPHLSSPDRFIRNAARVAIESRDVKLWKSRALVETDPQAAVTALLALARCGDRETQNDLLYSLQRFPLALLSEDQLLEALRVLELSFARQGKPDGFLARQVVDELEPLYPANSEAVNRELVQLLVFLESPNVAAKTLALVDRAKSREEQIHYIFCLRNLKSGWTLEQRQKYFDWFVQSRTVDTSETAGVRTHPVELLRWFKDVDRDYSDGVSFAKYLLNIRKDALSTLTAADRTALGQVIKENLDVAAWKESRKRSFVKQWTVADLEPDLDRVGSGRDFLEGKNAFNDAQCILCHRFGNEGGSVGPELTAAASKYSRRDILQSMLEPSKVVSDQYQNYTIVKKNGETETGRITDENDDRIVVLPNPLEAESRVEIKKTDIARRLPSNISPMPEGLLNGLSYDEILDLLAYIEAVGKSGAKNFKK